MALLNFILQMVFSVLPDTRLYSLKRVLLRFRGFNISKNVRVVSSASFKLRNLSIGDNSFIGHGVLITGGADSTVSIGENVDIAPNCTIVSGSHEIGDSKHRAGRGFSADITISSGVWIGASSTVLGGVFIGQGSVVAAGSVVKENIPENVLVAGNPAKIKKNLC